MAEERFRDSGASLFAFAHDVLVVCPRCSGRAVVSATADSSFAAPRRLVCASCGLVKERDGRDSSWGEPIDPWFHEQLWLAARFRDQTVWAFNSAHATVLREFVAASHRQRADPMCPSGPRITTMGMTEKLPAWFKAAGNRAPLLKVLDSLIARAE